MKCHGCEKDNLLFCGHLNDGRYRYQCPSCHGAWAFEVRSFTPGEPLEWVVPFGAPALPPPYSTQPREAPPKQRIPITRR